MRDFITKDDHFGIRQELRTIFNGRSVKSGDEFQFNAWVNQWLPPAFYESKGTIARHFDEIVEILNKKYDPDWVWIKRNGQYTCAVITADIMSQLKQKMISLPLYLEIEEEKTRWQKEVGYRKEEGFSDPIKEEYVRIRFNKRG